MHSYRSVVGSILACSLLTSAGAVHAIEVDSGDFKFKGYGFIRMDAAYDLDEDLGRADQHLYGGISRPGTVATSDGDLDMTANASRLGFTVDGPSDTAIKLEGDFYGDTFRIRHAYASWKGLLFGQTWMNFNTLLASPGQLNFTGPSGRAGFSRKPQIRYTTYLGTNELAFSVEDPEGNILNQDASNDMPDVTVRFQGALGAFDYSAAALARRVSYMNAGEKESGTGYGAAVAARWTLTSSTQLRASLMFGEGMGNYMNSSPAPSAYVAPGGEVELIETGGYVFAITQGFGARFSGNLGYTHAEADWDDAADAGVADPTEVRKAQDSLYANVTYAPIKNLKLGLEVARHSVEWQDGEDAQAMRLLWVGQYSF